MKVDASTIPASYESVLRDLVNSFELDVAFLRHTDLEARTTVLIAEWPPRTDVADPDPLRVVPFADADPVFASAEFMDDIVIFRAGDGADEYRKIVESASGFVAETLAVVPMVDNATTVGLLGFAKLAGREWTDDEFNALYAIAALMTQAHSRVEAENRFRHVASHDELTGLSNRRALLEHLRARLDDPPSGPVAILFLVLDQLKALNDFLGHLAGDEYISAAADLLRREVGSSVMIARLGGDEFVLVLDGPSNAYQADIVASALLRSISKLNMPGVDKSTRGLVGISIAYPGRISAEAALQRADQAALIAKINGADNIVQYTDSVRRQSELRSDVEIHLRAAIQSDALVLHFQPEIDLIDHTITAVEALVRWQHPIRGLLPPSAFIPVAEASNLAGEMGHWVLDRACRTLAEWRAAIPGLDISMRVNASPSQLVSNRFVLDVDRMLQQYGLEGPSLCLEITEVAVVQDLAGTRRTLTGLRRLGVHVAIDDFGTGYSALSHLKELPVDALKIDRSFVTGLGTADRDDLAIIDSVIGLASAFNLDVIAEGVETRAAADVLIDRGCTRAQGYLISKPVPADDALALLRHGTIDI